MLESSAGLEVLELGVPAEHLTRADRSFPLLEQLQGQHEEASSAAKAIFGGQRFVRYQASEAGEAGWQSEAGGGLEVRSTGVAAATAGLAEVSICRRSAASVRPSSLREQTAPILFARVNRGTACLETASSRDAAAQCTSLGEGDTFTVPSGHWWRLDQASAELELLRFELFRYDEEDETSYSE